MKKIREFHCPECHRIQERLVKDDIKVIECKNCGHPETKRIISAAVTNGNSAHGMVFRR